MASAVIQLSVILLLVAVISADDSNPLGSTQAPPVSEACLSCICQATSGCRQQGTQCQGDYCGVFYISRAYWEDAGKPTKDEQCPTEPDAYSSCTNDPYCSALTVQGYMRRFAQDCNGDGLVDCYDYMAIHRKGGYGCTGRLPSKYVHTFNQCVSAVGGV